MPQKKKIHVPQKSGQSRILCSVKTGCGCSSLATEPICHIPSVHPASRNPKRSRGWDPQIQRAPRDCDYCPTVTSLSGHGSGRTEASWMLQHKNTRAPGWDSPASELAILPRKVGAGDESAGGRRCPGRAEPESAEAGRRGSEPESGDRGLGEGGTLKRLLAADWSSERHFLSQLALRRQFAGSSYLSPRARSRLRVLRSAGQAARSPSSPADLPGASGPRFRWVCGMVSLRRRQAEK